MKISSVAPAKFDDIFEIFAESYVQTMDIPLIVVDDGLTKKVRDKYDKFSYIPAPSPYGFPKSINRGVSFAGGGDVILFNDDCYIHTEGLAWILQKVAYASDKIGAVSPIRQDTLTEDFENDSMDAAHEAYLTELGYRRDDLMDVDGVSYEITGGRPYFTTVYIKRSTWVKVGQMDEDFVSGRDDADWSVRMEDAGFLTARCWGGFVEHGGMRFDASISNTRRRVGLSGTSQEEVDLFVKKHGIDRQKFAGGIRT